MSAPLVYLENHSCHTFDILMNDGEMVDILHPNKFIVIPMYAANMFTFRDRNTMTQNTVPGHKLLTCWSWNINNKGVQFRSVRLPIGLLVVIDPIVLDLRHLCLVEVVNTVTSIDDVRQLKIWMDLKHELISMVEIRDFLTSRYDMDPNYIIPAFQSEVAKNVLLSQ